MDIISSDSDFELDEDVRKIIIQTPETTKKMMSSETWSLKHKFWTILPDAFTIIFDVVHPFYTMMMCMCFSVSVCFFIYWIYSTTPKKVQWNICGTAVPRYAWGLKIYGHYLEWRGLFTTEMMPILLGLCIFARRGGWTRMHLIWGQLSTTKPYNMHNICLVLPLALQSFLQDPLRKASFSSWPRGMAGIFRFLFQYLKRRRMPLSLQIKYVYSSAERTKQISDWCA